MGDIFVVIAGIVGGLIAAFGPLVFAFYAFHFVEERTDNLIFPWLVTIAILVGSVYLFAMWDGGDFPIERPCNHC